MNAIKALGTLGQSVWLDSVRRAFLDSGGLQRLIDDDGVTGVTTNPAIFERAIAGSRDYASAIAALAYRDTLDDEALYESLAMADVQRVADLLLPVYRRTNGREGYVSLEVSPLLSQDTLATAAAARRLWKEVDRPNLMIKIPATAAGVPAFEELVAEGLNVNVTLLFSLDTYEQVAASYIRGIQERHAAGQPLTCCASVASFFLSRIDTAVDAHIEALLANTHDPVDRAILQSVRGQTAIACARLAYQRWKAMFNTPGWKALEAAGARPQRLLWASTSTKNPAYSDVRYVETLIGPETVNTIPPATLDAFRDHGHAQVSLEEGVDAAALTLRNLDRLGIDLSALTADLLAEGLTQFSTAYNRLLDAVSAARTRVLTTPADRQSAQLPSVLSTRVRQVLKDWRDDRKVQRLWSRDATLWTGRGENKWLEWLDIVPAQIGRLGELRNIGHLFEGRYFNHLVLLGMGGSSLAAEVIAGVLGNAPAHPELIVLDSTDPDQLQHIEQKLDVARTLFIVASKSGTTLETRMLADYFLERVANEIGQHQAASHFVAITDQGSPLERFASARDFRAIYHGRRGIGGRYSALSDFGMVPAAMLGVDIERFLERTAVMVEACSAATPVEENPAVALGVLLGTARQAGWDKVTFIATPGIESLSAWLEQLLAESTGKLGTGLIPVSGEDVEPPSRYGEDRLFVHLRIAADADPVQDDAVDQLSAAGHPVLRIDVDDRYDIGQEFYRWEMATAVAGAVLHLNPFDQPDVEGAKLAARQLAVDVTRRSGLADGTPVADSNGLSLYATAEYAAALGRFPGSTDRFNGLLAAHLGQLRPNDYFALLGYLDRADPEVAQLLEQIRHAVRAHHRNATCVGYGPRYLHATGQVYKGGPNTGVFVVLTRDVQCDLQPSDSGPSFGTTQLAQAIADQRELAARGRRVVRVHLGADPVAGLRRLLRLIQGQ